MVVDDGASGSVGSEGQAVTFNEAAHQSLPNSNLINRLLWIRCGSRLGTAFAIEIDNRQFVVTAAHIVEDFPRQPLLRNWMGRWEGVEAQRITANPDFVDVAIFAPKVQISAAPAINLGSDALIFGQELMVLGYPFDPDEFAKEADPIYLANGSPLPMVKRAGFAWMRKAPGAGHMTLYLDCYANEGFSGGPVCGYPALRGSAERDLTIAALVSHYVPDSQPVLDGANATPLTSRQNPGILVAPTILHAVDGIHSAGVTMGAAYRATTL
jgi:hypothetical protein